MILANEAPRRNRSMGVADMGVAGFGGKPVSRKVATLARSPFIPANVRGEGARDRQRKEVFFFRSKLILL